MVAGTCTSGDVDPAVEVQVETIAELVPSACAVVSEISVPANVQLGIVMLEMEWEVMVVDVNAGCKCEYGNVGSFEGGADGRENCTMCSF